MNLNQGGFVVAKGETLHEHDFMFRILAQDDSGAADDLNKQLDLATKTEEYLERYLDVLEEHLMFLTGGEDDVEELVYDEFFQVMEHDEMETRERIQVSTATLEKLRKKQEELEEKYDKLSSRLTAAMLDPDSGDKCEINIYLCEDTWKDALLEELQQYVNVNVAVVREKNAMMKFDNLQLPYHCDQLQTESDKWNVVSYNLPPRGNCLSVETQQFTVSKILEELQNISYSLLVLSSACGLHHHNIGPESIFIEEGTGTWSLARFIPMNSMAVLFSEVHKGKRKLPINLSPEISAKLRDYKSKGVLRWADFRTKVDWAKADVYSLGFTLVCVLTGLFPATHPALFADYTGAELVKVLQERVLDRLTATVSSKSDGFKVQQLESLLLRMISHSPKDRPTLSDLLERSSQQKLKWKLLCNTCC